MFSPVQITAELLFIGRRERSRVQVLSIPLIKRKAHVSVGDGSSCVVATVRLGAHEVEGFGRPDIICARRR
jgi:hypothetical protein